MWRNSASKLVSFSNPKSNNLKPPYLLLPSIFSFNLNYAIRDPLSHLQLYSTVASTSASAANHLKSVPGPVLGSAIVNPTSFAALSASKVRDVVDLAKHYGRCYYELSKARLSMLVVATSGTGYVLGSGNFIDYVGLCCTCAGTMMVAASANTLNQVYEINNDSKMKRTQNRPLPSGRLTVPHAVTWAACAGVGGAALLASKANMMAASLAVSNLVLYAFVYTPLKQMHPINTWVGAVVGAIPPLLGWAAAAGDVSLNAMILPAALYFWQIPHFMALAYLCRKDYADGGFRMFSLTDASGKRTAMVALRNCLYLLPLGYLAYDRGIASGWFCLESTILALAISGTALSFYLNRTSGSARKMFRASLLYLPVFMAGLLFHRLPSSQHNQLLESFPDEVKQSFASDLLQEGSAGINNGQSKQRNKTAGVRRQPPVAYASVAPFPFLPAPVYATE